MLDGPERVGTGVLGLDELIQGGIPKGRIIVLMGEPGAGKTILSVQFLVSGMVKQGEKCLYVCMDEEKKDLFREMLQFGWNLAEFEEKGLLHFIDATPLRFMPERTKLGLTYVDRKDFTLSSVIEVVQRTVKETQAARIVVDSMTPLILQYGDVMQRRWATMELVTALTNTSATCVLTREMKTLGYKRGLEVEEFISHGVITLQSLKIGSNIVRVLQVQKMRETMCDTQPRPYFISKNGIEVRPKATVFE
ncbi:MAG: AAA family ATPase [Thaumarchaeota archaeon]|nr:AAA family ATPase [Nitrososphaerota archaeon]